MNRKTAFTKICDKLDSERKVIAKMIYDAAPGDEFFFGMYTLTYNRTDEESSSGKSLYMLSLYKNKNLETRVLADIS